MVYIGHLDIKRYRCYHIIMKHTKVAQHRIQVNLPVYLYQELRRKAFEEEVSISELIRRAIVSDLYEKKIKRGSQERWEEFIRKHVGVIRGKRDDSYDHIQNLDSSIMSAIS